MLIYCVTLVTASCGRSYTDNPEGRLDQTEVGRFQDYKSAEEFESTFIYEDEEGDTSELFITVEEV